METTIIKSLFQKHKIGNKYPDAIILDYEEGDHKFIFYHAPKYLEKHTTHDHQRTIGKYYMKEKNGNFIPCYPVLVEMYEYKNIFSGDHKPSDLWIGSPKDIKLQYQLALKKKGKREYREYKSLK